MISSAPLEFRFTARVLTIQAERGGLWHYVLLPAAMGAEIRHWVGGRTSGWGSIRVQATIGDSTWQTSLFPSKANRTLLLPLKAAIRAAEHVEEGDEVTVTITA